jgi:hypothetical protein
METGTPLEVLALRPFEAARILPTQYRAPRRSSWCTRLAAAQLEDAAGVLRTPGRDPALYEATRRWVQGEDAPLSFAWCCSVLQVCPERLRARLLK